MNAPGLYVHVPFCRTRCVYCDFCSSTRPGEADRWLDALALEAEAAAGQWDAFDTLYIGGGTPTVLLPTQLESLLHGLFQCFSFHPEVDITLEANPADLDRDSAALLAALGVNRVSLGAQSFDDEVLAFLGRRHRSADIGRSCQLLRTAGIGQLSIDLISAIPGQTVEHWLETLRRAVELESDHLSCYQLTMEEDTPLGRRVQRGEVKPQDEETAAAQFLAGAELLAGLGYEQYRGFQLRQEPRTAVTAQHEILAPRSLPWPGPVGSFL